MKTTKIILGIIVVILAIYGVYKLVTPSETRFGDNSTLTGGLNVQGTLTQQTTDSTSTPASLTLQASDLATYNSIQMLPTVGAITVTLPASTSLATYYPTYLANSGDMTTFSFINSSSTAAATITIAGGTGTLLKKATTTAVIPAGGVGVFNIMRKSNSDIIFSLDINGL